MDNFFANPTTMQHRHMIRSLHLLCHECYAQLRPHREPQRGDLVMFGACCACNAHTDDGVYYHQRDAFAHCVFEAMPSPAAVPSPEVEDAYGTLWT